MTKHKTDDKQDKLLRHAEVFADFWLGIAGAGARGLAEALGKPAAENAPHKRLEERLEKTVDRAARAVRVAFDEAKRAAHIAEEELARIHSPEPREAASPSAATDAILCAAKQLSSRPPKAQVNHFINEMMAKIAAERDRSTDHRDES